MQANLPARLTALALGFLGLASLRGQFDVLALQGLWPRLWLMAAFFTILTNVLLTLHLLAIAKGWRIPASRAAGLLCAILMVALLYHLLLAGLRPLTGAAWWADQGLHSAMPLGYLGWWLAFAPKNTRWSDLPFWMIWPMAYLGYSLIRGSQTGFWPYPFLDATALGWPRTALNILGVAMTFAALAAGVHLAAQRLQSRPS